jgi:GGDEF domain-containing protein
MAASDIQISDLLVERIEEEIARAERSHAPLSCLLVGVQDPDAIERAYGKSLATQAIAYLGLTLRSEIRRYDRVGPANAHDHLVVLPGADDTRGEIVARRALTRLRAIKIETQDERETLSLTVGIATWREGLNAHELIARAWTAAGRRTLEQSLASLSLPSGPIGFLHDAVRI